MFGVKTPFFCQLEERGSEEFALPKLIKTIDEISRETRRDVFWVRFASSLCEDRDVMLTARKDQLAWFDQQGLAYEIAAPIGWLEGDPGCFVVGFDGSDDPRLQAYSSQFEHANGSSLKPDLYQMYVVPFRGDGNE